MLATEAMHTRLADSDESGDFRAPLEEAQGGGQGWGQGALKAVAKALGLARIQVGELLPREVLEVGEACGLAVVNDHGHAVRSHVHIELNEPRAQIQR